MKGVTRVLVAMPTLLRIGFAEMVAYRAEMIIWVLSATLPLVMLALWNAAAADGPLAGFGQVEIARYFTITLIVRHLCSVWVVWELNHLIRTGGLSSWLLRPVHPLWWNVAETLTAQPFRMAIILPMLGGLYLWKPEILFVPTLLQGLSFVVSVGLALVVSWAIQAIFGMLAFWFDQSLGAFNAWFVLWSFLSGYIVPLPLLPAWLGDIAAWLPFHASLGAPIGLLLGLAPNPLAELAVQAGWAAALVGAAALMWRAGIRRYGAFGA